MSVTYGFYNSIGGDRVYNATQLSSLFDGIITDGVFMSIGDGLVVIASTGMNVIVGPGRAWFNQTWTNNDVSLVLTIAASEAVLNRIDMIVLEVDTSEEVRANSIKIIKGTPGSSPAATALVDTEFVHQYPLAHIYVGANVTSIITANITNKIGTVDCPFTTGILESLDISALLAQWEGEFDDWMATLVDILDESTAGNLLNLINARALYKRGSDTFISGGTTKTVTDAFITADTQVIISPTQTKVGSWSVSSAAGSFTVTSDETETSNVTFDWGATK